MAMGGIVRLPGSGVFARRVLAMFTPSPGTGFEDIEQQYSLVRTDPGAAVHPRTIRGRIRRQSRRLRKILLGQDVGPLILGCLLAVALAIFVAHSGA